MFIFSYVLMFVLVISGRDVHVPADGHVCVQWYMPGVPGILEQCSDGLVLRSRPMVRRPGVHGGLQTLHLVGSVLEILRTSHNCRGFNYLFTSLTLKDSLFKLMLLVRARDWLKSLPWVVFLIYFFNP